MDTSVFSHRIALNESRSIVRNRFWIVEKYYRTHVVASLWWIAAVRVEKNASSVAVSATLKQRRRPVTFTSRLLSQSKLHHPSVEKRRWTTSVIAESACLLQRRSQNIFFLSEAELRRSLFLLILCKDKFAIELNFWKVLWSYLKHARCRLKSRAGRVNLRKCGYPHLRGGCGNPHCNARGCGASAGWTCCGAGARWTCCGCGAGSGWERFFVRVTECWAKAHELNKLKNRKTSHRTEKHS